LASLPAETVVAWAPAPGAQRLFSAAELKHLAERLGAAGPAPVGDVCVERRVEPLDAARVLTALRSQLPETNIALLDYSRQPVPEGTLEFPITGLRRALGPMFWYGFVRYAGGRHFAVWAKVRVRLATPVVVAAEDLKPGQAIDAAQLKLETREDVFPRETVQALSGVAGKVPRRPIRAGTVVSAEALGPAPDVARGDTVQVEVRIGSARLALDGLVESSAFTGQRVAVRNPISNKRFLARVEGKGRVSVRPENP
jgi:flagella basal body P-ring formation protein FlgA